MKLFISFAIAGAFALTACTKARPYKTLGKPDTGVKQVAVAAIDTQADWLYVPSTLESARYASGARPHFTADAKRVRFKFTENALQVVAPEEDGRFQENSTNNAAVLSIPVEYLEYRCAVDDYGDCTNKEELNEDIPWFKKSQFKIDPDKLATQQISFLPMEIQKFFIGCYVEVGSEFLKSEFSGDAINLTLEKTFQAKPPCANFQSIESLEDLTFSVRYQYSFVKLNKMATKNYKAVEYTRDDEGNFGFFNTERHQLDIDNNDVVKSEKHYMDRWNPNRTVTYYLSADFAKPENASVRQATYDAITVINDGLVKAGTPLRFELKDPVEGMSSGDIRNSMIVLEEDPAAAGLLGYGPHVSNPQTGEILSAKVIMYLGTMKKYLKYAYDDVVNEKLAAANGGGGPGMSNLSMKDGIVAPQSQNRVSPLDTAIAGIRSTLRAEQAQLNSSNAFGGQQISMTKLNQLASSPTQAQTFTKDIQERLEFMYKNCFYPAEMANFDESIIEGVDKIVQEVGLKPWADLTDEERTKVINALLPYEWLPTLIHELGHNLGLRHNFDGSMDQANFYSQDELKQMGVSRPFKYSSVMDYAYRTNYELRVMGKYDVAALRYAYAEKIALKDGTEISIDDLHKDPKVDLKPYSYCTDEHVGVNANCNRFDEGTTFTEIAQHYVEAYAQRYKRSNLRNGRRRFSLLQDSSQLGALDDTFLKLRMMFERYESIKNNFDLADDNEAWKSSAFLSDVHNATAIAGQFFLDVLKTPDIYCAVAKKTEPTKVVGVLPIRSLSKRAISCFDSENVGLNPAYMIAAEGGKSFVSRKDPNNNNPFADQIDVRGIYIDKLLASHYLFARELGNSIFDQYTENFLQFSDLQQPILKTVNDLLEDNLTGPVDFHTATGQTARFNIQYRLFDTADADNSHKITPIMDDMARYLLGLPESTTSFHAEFVKSIFRNMPSQAHHEVASGVLNLLKVRTELPRDGRENEYLAVEFNGQRYFVHPSSEMAAQLFQNFDITSTLEPLSKEQFGKIMASIAQDAAGTPAPTEGTVPAPAAPISLTADEQAAKALGKDVLTKFMNGDFQNSSYYSFIIQTLAAN